MRGLRWTTLVVAALIGVAEYGFGQGPSPQTPVEMKTMTVAELEKAGDACRARKEYAEAIQYFREAVRKDKKNPVLYNKLGLAELRANDLQAARADFERATKYNSKYPEAWNNLGAVDYIHRNFGSAARYFKKAVALDETRASFHANLGNAWFSQKKIERAVREYSRALELDPEVMSRHSTVGVAAQVVSQEEQAHFYYLLAKVHAQHGDLESCLHCLKMAKEYGYRELAKVYTDEEFSKLRDDARLHELVPPPIAK
jgi:tetratricopeptide (TPR) repeat protein